MLAPGPQAPTDEVTPADMAAFRAAVREVSGQVLAPHRDYYIQSKLRPLVNELGFSSYKALIVAVPRSPDLGRRVSEALAVHETAFFRDTHPFQTIRSVVFPRLLAQRGLSRTLNVWSAAAALGQEIYSVAFMLNDMSREFANWQLQLFATDFSHEAVERVRNGVYATHEVVRGLSMNQIEQYFMREGPMSWRVKADIRRLVKAQVHNLLKPAPSTFPKMDIVFLRNVLIYFNADTQRQVIQHCFDQLKVGGVMLIGASETIYPLPHGLVRYVIDRTVLYQREH